MKYDIKKEYIDKVHNSLSEEDFNSYIKSLDKPVTHGFTLNLKKLLKSKLDLDFIINRFNAKLIFRNDNFAYLIYDKELLEKNSIFPGKDPLYHVGLYYIQEPSAAIPLFNVEFKNDDVILDLCASPGGKTCEALYNLDKKTGGFLVSNDIKTDRAKILSSNIERMGFDNAIVTNNSAGELSKAFNEYFDKIIIDAPCSGEGMMRKNEEARRQWSESLVLSCQRIQRGLIDESYSMLKKGGYIIYSTCTFSHEEDEDNVRYIIERYKDIKLIKIEKIYPFQDIGEGQFYAILKKDGTDNNKSDWPSLQVLKSLRVLRYGLKLEDDVNGRKEPSHAITHNDDNYILKESIELDDREAIKYLHGEVLRKNTDVVGWCKVTYKGMGLGLVKVTSGVLKNHYPKGLRMM